MIEFVLMSATQIMLSEITIFPGTSVILKCQKHKEACGASGKKGNASVSYE